MNGLSSDQVADLQKKYGKNELGEQKRESFFVRIFKTITEPMILLLIVTAILYLILGEPSDGAIMFISVAAIITIDVIQEWKTDKTLRALKQLSSPKVTVLRDGTKQEIESSELVPSDIIFIQEGIKIPADGFVVKYSNLAVDESSLTGESEPVWKNTSEPDPKSYWKNNYCYQGTLVVQGTGVLKVDKIGAKTEYGKIGKNLSSAKEIKTPLQIQTNKLVKICAFIALGLFLMVAFITFVNSDKTSVLDRFIQSLLSGLTIAMAMIPEEFPVILTVFLSMGAWRLAKKRSVVKKLPKVEVLGAITTLCVDKTGTITKNEMAIQDLYAAENASTLISHMCLSSEEETYDPMENAIFNYAENLNISKKELFNNTKIKNFAFSNQTKTVGAAWTINGENYVVAKGSPENILKLCDLSETAKKQIKEKISDMQSQGLRVIAGASAVFSEQKIAKSDKLKDFKLDFDGIIGLTDPPRDDIEQYIEKCYSAGVRVIMITGDNGITASAIAKKVGIKDVENIITGPELEEMSDDALKQAVKNVTIFSRVIPEHKMRIVKALQESGEIVAMTGDGVNDAPALKQANIGIAMGGRGSEVAREAADLVLLDDNFKTIVDTIEDGRRIYDNIRKAMEYIIIIHIPIALSALIAPLIGIGTASLFLLPPQVVLFELIVDPTCSLVLERRPAESNIMNQPPRGINQPIINFKNLSLSLFQGFIIFVASFGLYYLYLPQGAELARTLGLLVIMLSNLFLVFVYTSEHDLAYKTFKTLIKDKVVLSINLALATLIILVTYTPINSLFGLTAPNLLQLLVSVLVAFAAVFWFEIFKFTTNKRANRRKNR